VNIKKLLLIRHASKCNYSDDKCPVLKNCSKYKSLWIHLLDCKEKSCTYLHCLSSRRLLTHFSNCKENTCKLCLPVRNAIKQKNDLISNVVNILHQEKYEIDNTNKENSIPINNKSELTIKDNNNNINKLNLKINTTSEIDSDNNIPPSIITPSTTNNIEFSSSFSPLNNNKDTCVYKSNYTNIENVNDINYMEDMKKKLNNHENRIEYCENLINLLLNQVK
jgi:hypothetical protein